jgi:hypothetical protein
MVSKYTQLINKITFNYQSKLFLIIHSDEEEADLVLHVILLLLLIKQHNDYRGNRDNITRSAILSSKLSPWRHLLVNADEASFLFTEEELVRERYTREREVDLKI